MQCRLLVVAPSGRNCNFKYNTQQYPQRLSIPQVLPRSFIINTLCIWKTAGFTNTRLIYIIFMYPNFLKYTACPRRKGQLFWQFTVSVILTKKKFVCTCVLFRTISEIQLFHCRVHCTDKQHAMSSHKLQSALPPVEFLKIIILNNLYQLCHLNNKYRY
jgi:hypothetical protein